MKKRIIICVIALQLSACNAYDTTNRALNTVENNASTTWNKARELAGFNHKKKIKEPHTQARYCYKSYSDISCYAQPVPGEEERLVAYQGNTGQTGYVLPSTRKEHNNNTVSAPSTVILPPLKSVDVGTLPKIADSDTVNKNKKQLKEIIFDPAELHPKELVPQKAQ